MRRPDLPASAPKVRGRALSHAFGIADLFANGPSWIRVRVLQPEEEQLRQLAALPPEDWAVVAKRVTTVLPIDFLVCAGSAADADHVGMACGQRPCCGAMVVLGLQHNM
jgi:hypothetical protein